jgi:hypothetical protein
MGPDDKKIHDISLCQIVAGGLTAARGALLGAVYLFLLQAPLQVLNALAQHYQGGAMAGRRPDPALVLLSLALSFASLLLALAVFFLFPLVQGGILGQVRDRLTSPRQPPGPFGAYGRRFYLRLLGSEGLFALVLFAFLVPAISLATWLAFQEVA